MATKKIFAYLGIIVLLASSTLHAESFLIKKDDTTRSKKWSRNKLREEIGSQVKELFTTTIAMTQELGSLQVMVAAQKTTTASSTCEVLQKNGSILQELSSLQRVCSRLLEGLIDNHRVFKNSDKKELTALHSRVAACAESLKEQHDVVKQCAMTPVVAKKETITLTSTKHDVLPKDNDLVTQHLAGCLTKLTEHAFALNNDVCIKSL